MRFFCAVAGYAVSFTHPICAPRISASRLQDPTVPWRIARAHQQLPMQQNIGTGRAADTETVGVEANAIKMWAREDWIATCGCCWQISWPQRGWVGPDVGFDAESTHSHHCQKVDVGVWMLDLL